MTHLTECERIGILRKLKQAHRRTILLGFLTLNACHSAVSDSGNGIQGAGLDVIVPIEIDGTALYVPSIWNVGNYSKARPWRNGVMAQTGGWGQFQPTLGPLAAVGSWGWPEDGIFRASSTGQPVDSPDPFFELSIIFEFPLPPARSDDGKTQSVDYLGTDFVDLKYRAPGEQPLTYVSLLHGLKPKDGDDVGDGWREVTRTNKSTPMTIRFDASDWVKRGGALPTRLAESVSGSKSKLWTHHLALAPRGWSMDFESQSLPLSR